MRNVLLADISIPGYQRCDFVAKHNKEANMRCLEYVVRLSRFGIVAMLAALSGCVTYRTPGGAADFAIIADEDIKIIFDRKPVAPIPARLATVRVQAPGYRSYTNEGYGRGRYSVVTVRDVETADDFERVAGWPQVRQLAPLNRLLLGEELDSERALRRAAASLHADLLLLYTFDTSFHVHDAIPALSVITFGLSPNQRTRVTTTASAIIVDVRTGFVYGACEATAVKEQLASAWTSTDAVDQSRLKTERQAFVELVGRLEGLWNDVVAERTQ